MNNNRNGGIGRLLVIVVIVAVLFLVVKNVGVENITKKANGSLDSLLSRSSEQLGDITTKDEEQVDYNSDRPYKNHNQEVLEGLKENIKEYDKNKKDFSIKDFRKDNSKYVLVNDEYSKNWKDFNDNDKCSTYKAALITLGKDVKIKDDCTIIEGSWEDQYAENTKEDRTEDKKKSDSKDKEKKTSSIKKKSFNEKDYHNFVVDNVVPLENVWSSGYGQLDSSMRINSANDRINMMITTPQNNKRKGISTIDKWTPDKNSKYYCDYADRYGLVKNNYSLSVTQAEYDALEKIYKTCNAEQK